MLNINVIFSRANVAIFITFNFSSMSITFKMSHKPLILPYIGNKKLDEEQGLYKARVMCKIRAHIT